MISKSERILITGGSGLVGSALSSYLSEQGFLNVYSLNRSDCDLTDRASTLAFFRQLSPDYVFHLAASVYGIMGNMRNQESSFLQNSRINLNVIEACHLVDTKKIVAMGTVAAYPAEPVNLPLKETDFWYGLPHESEFGYAQAKRAMLAHLMALHKSHGNKFAYVISTNLYGLNDKFDIEHGHVIPSLIRKFYEANIQNKKVTIWGDGSARRDFLYAQDAARALLLILEKIEGPVNMASGFVHSIREVVSFLSDYLDMGHLIEWDLNKPQGQHYRSFDTSILAHSGFVPAMSLRDGLIKTYEWYKNNCALARK